MHVFYSNKISGNTVSLDETESKHAVQVLRLKPGDNVLVMDGVGGKHNGFITVAHSRHCSVEIIKSDISAVAGAQLHIAIAPVKMNDRMEWFLEKATEIGIHIITPVICERSERKIVNMERFNKILVSAMKQSMQPFLPVLNQALSFKGFIGQFQPGFIAHCNNNIGDLLWNVMNNKNTCVLIGPEGDFSPAEVEMAVKKGWKEVSLGNMRLRTETAGLMVCAAFALKK